MQDSLLLADSSSSSFLLLLLLCCCSGCFLFGCVCGVRGGSDDLFRKRCDLIYESWCCILVIHDPFSDGQKCKRLFLFLLPFSTIAFHRLFSCQHGSGPKMVFSLFCECLFAQDICNDLLSCSVFCCASFSIYIFVPAYIVFSS